MQLKQQNLSTCFQVLREDFFYSCKLDVEISASSILNAVYPYVTLTANINETGITYNWQGGAGSDKTYIVFY